MGLSVSCSVVCNPGGAAITAEIFVVVAGSVKADALYMLVVCACCAPNSTAAGCYLGRTFEGLDLS